MALLGSGWQAGAHLITLSLVRDLKTIKVFSPTTESRKRFLDEWNGKTSAELVQADSAAQAIDGVDIVTCTTNSISALFPGELLQPGMHVSCVKPCELDAATYRRSDPLIIHWKEAKPFQIVIGVDPQSIPDVAEGWPHPLTREDSAVWDLPTLSQLVTGQHPGRIKDESISCFCNNVGLGLQFAAVGSEVLARAREARVGARFRRIGFWSRFTHSRCAFQVLSVGYGASAHVSRFIFSYFRWRPSNLPDTQYSDPTQHRTPVRYS